MEGMEDWMDPPKTQRKRLNKKIQKKKEMSY